MIKVNFNGSEYDIAVCLCGSMAVEYDAGMMGCVIRCLSCKRQVVHNGFQEALETWNGGDMGSRLTGATDRWDEESLVNMVKRMFAYRDWAVVLQNAIKRHERTVTKLSGTDDETLQKQGEADAKLWAVLNQRRDYEE